MAVAVAVAAQFLALRVSGALASGLVGAAGLLENLAVLRLLGCVLRELLAVADRGLSLSLLFWAATVSSRLSCLWRQEPDGARQTPSGISQEGCGPGPGLGGTAGPKGQRQAVGGRLWAGRWWGWALTPVTAWDKRTHLEGGGRTMQPAWAAPWERGLQWPARVAEGG